MKAGKSNLYGNNKELKGFALANRLNMTKAEACLWKYVLKAHQMHGHQFHRQKPVLNYIADFMCKELQLIIDVDGITHTYEEVVENDLIRQNELEDAGFAVLRFTDDEVLTSIDAVAVEIEKRISDNELS